MSSNQIKELTCGEYSLENRGKRSGHIECKNLATEYHDCPFLADIYNDSETLCRCCADCSGDCSDER